MFAAGGSLVAPTSEAGAQSFMRVAGTVSKFDVRLNANAGPAGSSFTFTVRKNGVDTGITCTVSGATSTCSDIANNAVFAANDLISISIVPSAADPTDHLDARWSAVFTSS
jgi:hypothetical protein